MEPARAASLEPQWMEEHGGGPESRAAWRSQSLGRDSRRRALAQAGHRPGGTLPARGPRQRALVTQGVNPFLDCPSLRRGFTLNGQPIPHGSATEEKLAIIKVKEESSAYFFWAIYFTLVILAVGNLITTLIIVNVLRVGSTGLEALEFLPGGRGLRLFGSADLGAVTKLDGIISSFQGESLAVSGAGLEVAAGGGPRLSLTPEMVRLEGVHDFSVIDPATGEVLFSTSDPELALPDGLEKLEAEEAEVERITAPVGEDLLVRSERDLVVRGAEGVEVGGSQLSLTSASDILLSSAAGAVELAGAVRLDAVMLPHGGGGFSGEEGQFKLCVCLPSGVLFKVAVPSDNPSRPLPSQVGCHSVDLSKDNPC